MLSALGPLRLGSRCAHCDPELATRIGESWRRELARRLAKRMGEEEKEEEEEEEEEQL